MALDVAPSGARTRHVEGGPVDGAARCNGRGLAALAERGVCSGNVHGDVAGRHKHGNGDVARRARGRACACAATSPCTPPPRAPTSMPCSMSAVTCCAVHRASRRALCARPAGCDAKCHAWRSARSYTEFPVPADLALILYMTTSHLR